MATEIAHHRSAATAATIGWFQDYVGFRRSLHLLKNGSDLVPNVFKDLPSMDETARFPKAALLHQ